MKLTTKTKNKSSLSLYMNAAQLLDFTFAGEPNNLLDLILTVTCSLFTDHLFPTWLSRPAGLLARFRLWHSLISFSCFSKKNELHARLKVLQRHCTVVVLVSTWQIKVLGESKAEKFFRVHL